MKIKKFTVLAIICFSFIVCDNAMADKTKRVHPYTLKLYKAGLIEKISMHFPEIPRMLASTALGLYKSNKALFIFISYKKQDLIHGAIHLTEGQVGSVDFRKLPLRKDQVLVFYCP